METLLPRRSPRSDDPERAEPGPNPNPDPEQAAAESLTLITSTKGGSGYL